MTTELKFTIAGPPRPKQRPRFYRGKVYTPQATRDYEQVCAAAAHDAVLLAGDWQTDRRYWVCLKIYFKDLRRRDLDNVEKSVCDGLNEIAWDDDCQIDYIQKRRYLDRNNPRIEVIIRYDRA
jgi:Holliday junction resolvase RusA-like endonuclease